MAFQFLESSKKQRTPSTRPPWSWATFWLAFSGGCLLVIAFFALKDSFQRSIATRDVEAPPQEPAPSFPTPPPPDISPEDLLKERPQPRPAPEAVNEFLREEQGLNSGRVELLRAQEIEIDEVDFASRVLPEWDFRTMKREVIWFYHYQSAALPNGQPLTVFGAVDGLGHPLFQYPPLAGDPLALLDSQYVALKWMNLDSPRLALIAASNGPWPESGATLDLFLVNESVSPRGPRSWRFTDPSYPEQPTNSPRLICFRDGDGDGLQDLCAVWHSGETAESMVPQAIWHRFDPELQSFTLTASQASELLQEALVGDYHRAAAGESLAFPHVMAAPATHRIFPPAPPENTAEAVEDPPST